MDLHRQPVLRFPLVPRADLIRLNSVLADHLELVARQLKLYARPEDSATLAIVRSALCAVRRARRAK